MDFRSLHPPPPVCRNDCKLTTWDAVSMWWLSQYVTGLCFLIFVKHTEKKTSPTGCIIQKKRFIYVFVEYELEHIQNETKK